MKKKFKLIIISLFIIFVSLPKIVLADQTINFSSTHNKIITTLSNKKTLVIYVPKNKKSYKNILVSFHGFGDNSLNSYSVTALENAIKNHDYSKTVVFFPIDGICRNVESTSVINKTVQLVYDRYQKFLKDNKISSYTLSVSQMSGTSDAANTFINLSSKKLNLFLFDSYLPNTYYNDSALKKVNNLIMISEITGSDYLGSAQAIGSRFKTFNSNGRVYHYIDSIHDHGSADDKGFNYLFPDFINKKALGDNYASANLKLQGSSGSSGQNSSSGSNNGSSNNNNSSSNDIKSTGLTSAEVTKQLNSMKSTPTYDELLKIAKDKYGMSEDTFKVAFGWAVNEGYDGAKNLSGEIDTYLGYLCDCIGINFYMGYGLNSAEELAKKIGGGNTSGIYSVSNLTAKADKAINNPTAYAAQFKGMYLALKYPEENAHACYGPSVATQNIYKNQGGVLFYQAKAYPAAPNYPIQVWALWYSGINHWVDDNDENKGSGTLHPNVDPEWHFTPSTPSQDYNNACSIKGTREAISFIGRAIVLATYIVPLIIIILGMVDFGKAVTSNDEKAIHKATSSLIKRFVAGIVVFILPITLKNLLNVFHINDLVNDADSYDSCLTCLFSPFKCADSLNEETNND